MKNKKILIIVGLIIAVVTIILIFTVNKKEITYNINFETDGGSVIKSQIVDAGEKVKKPNDPIKEGYVFVEWIYQDSTYDFSLEVKSDLTLTAKWTKLEENIETFIVRFDTNGGTTISNQIIEKGNKVSKPNDPIKNGYIFKGWTLDDKNYSFETNVNEDIELKAKWEKIKENSNNTTNNNTQNNNGNNNSDSNIDNNVDNDKPSTPTSPTVKKYTVTFNTEGGTAIPSQTINEGEKVVKPTNPVKDGFEFVEWTLNGNIYNFDSKVTKDITLFAKWKEIPKEKYTVTFNTNGGSQVESQTINEGDKVIEPESPKKTDYKFVGWQLNGKTYDFNSPVTNDIRIDAMWKYTKFKIKLLQVANPRYHWNYELSNNDIVSVSETYESVQGLQGSSNVVYTFSGKNPGIVTVTFNNNSETKIYVLNVDSDLIVTEVSRSE